MDEQITELKRQFPGRSQQIDFFRNIYLGSSLKDARPQSLFIYGPPSTGKTSLTYDFFNVFGNRTAFINCVECYTPRLLFERVMNQWTGWSVGEDNNYSSVCRVNHLQQFVHCIQEGVPGITDGIGKSESYYLILDRAERLRNMPSNILPAFLRLSELTGRNVAVIFISNVVFENFNMKGGSIQPLLLRFPEYTKEESLQILQLDYRPYILAGDEDEGEEDIVLDEEFYKTFLEIIYSIFCLNCKDISELRYFAALLYPVYIRPIEDGLAGVSEKSKLFKYANKYILDASDKLYLREISSSEWSREIMDEEEKPVNSKNIGRSELELPYYTKFLLIASYLASYNPHKFDIRYFSRTNEERRKKKGGATRKGRIDKLGGMVRQQLLGPKVFPVERMLAIFYSIIGDKLEDTVNIQIQITSLTRLRLLSRATAMDKLDDLKYKCNVNFDVIKSIAKSVRFEIEHYLYDFN
ncbi:origin recognition complex, subunit 5 [Pilobolus umbonatus]|nr:origin recognition complex, subunit 5 [Pilobolus umbonatus]